MSHLPVEAVLQASRALNATTSREELIRVLQGLARTFVDLETIGISPRTYGGRGG